MTPIEMIALVVATTWAAAQAHQAWISRQLITLLRNEILHALHRIENALRQHPRPSMLK